MSFLAAAFLAGLATLAVPWWLHRMNERAPAERNVASLMLMRETEEPVRTRRTLAHKILLALRLSLLAALTLAFAQPGLETTHPAEAKDVSRTRLILVDASFSMRRDGTWSRALETAEGVREAVSESFTALAGSGLVISDDLRSARPGFDRLEFAGLPARLDALIAGLPAQDRDWEVHLVSDFQASAVPGRFNALVEGANWPLVLHPVGEAADNWTIESARVAHGRLEAVVVGHGARRTVDVVLHGNGVEAGRTSVEVATGSSAVAAFDIVPAGPESVSWEVRLDANDAIADDDAYRVVQPARDATSIAIVDPTVTGSTDEGVTGVDAALTFLTAALSAIGVADPIRVDDAETWPRSMDAALVVDPGELPVPLLRRLERYLDGGGGALVIAGPRLQRRQVLPIGGDPLTGNIAAGARHVAVVDATHPVAQRSWRGVEVERSLSMPTLSGETILALSPTSSSPRPSDAQAPLLVEKRFGKGRLLVLLTALDRDWSSLVLRPTFVGFVRDAIDYLAQRLPLAAHAGQAIPFPATSVQIFDANNERVLALDSTAARPVVRIPLPGLYTVHTPGRESTMAVNIDPRESDLRGIPTQLLERWQSAADAVGSVPATDATGSADNEVNAAWHPLAPLLLVLAAMLLVLESCAANIGRMRVPWRYAWPRSTTA